LTPKNQGIIGKFNQFWLRACWDCRKLFI